MKTIQLPGSGRSTTQLAYGSSTLMAATGMRESLALLESAYDAGIRHVDTAPSYGYGAAEKCVGEFLQRHKDVTVATKYGIPAPKNRSLFNVARGMVKPLLRAVPGIKNHLSQLAAAATKKASAPKFTVEDARQTLEQSLRALRVERVDLWLLHEVSADDLGDELLLRLMEESVAAGKVGAFGVGSSIEKIPALYSQCEKYCRVMQFEWDPWEAEDKYLDRFCVRHRVLSAHLLRISAYLQPTSAICRQWSEVVGVDLAAPSVLSALLLQSALMVNSHGITLFSSKSKSNIKSNARVTEDASLDAPAARLRELLRGDGSTLNLHIETGSGKA